MFGGGSGFGSSGAPRFGGAGAGIGSGSGAGSFAGFGSGGGSASSPFKFGGGSTATDNKASSFTSQSPPASPWGGGGGGATVGGGGGMMAGRGGGGGGGLLSGSGPGASSPFQRGGGRGGTTLMSGGRGSAGGRGMAPGGAASVPFSPFGQDASVSNSYSREAGGGPASYKFGGLSDATGAGRGAGSSAYPNKWGDGGGSGRGAPSGDRVSGGATWARGQVQAGGGEDTPSSSTAAAGYPSFRPRASQQQQPQQGSGGDSYAPPAGGHGGGPGRGGGMGGFTYSCSVCQASFPTKILLKTHLSESNHWSVPTKDEQAGSDAGYRAPASKYPGGGPAAAAGPGAVRGGGRYGGRGVSGPPRSAARPPSSWQQDSADQYSNYSYDNGSNEARRGAGSAARVSFRNDGHPGAARPTAAAGAGGDRQLAPGRGSMSARPLVKSAQDGRGPGYAGRAVGSARSPRGVGAGGGGGGGAISPFGGAISSPESGKEAAETDATEGEDEEDENDEENDGENEDGGDEDSQLNYSQDEQDQDQAGTDNDEEDKEDVTQDQAVSNSDTSNLYGGVQQMAPPGASSVSKLLSRMKRPQSGADTLSAASSSDLSSPGGFSPPVSSARGTNRGEETPKGSSRLSESPVPTADRPFVSAKFPPKTPSSTTPDERSGPTQDKPFFSAKFSKSGDSRGSIGVAEEERSGPTADKPFFSTKFNKKSDQALNSSPAPITPSAPAVEHSDGQLVGQCTEMCPASERIRRVNEKDVHRLELPYPDGVGLPTDPSGVMIKKYQRSAADHVLAVPELVRTPPELLRTMDYIQSALMEKDLETVADPRFGEVPTTLEVYLYIWNRLRMVAKDFILQNYRFGGRNDRYCIECHERMVRWLIMMDHQLHDNKEYTDTHSQQNSEQLNKCLKSLNEFYDDARGRRESPDAQQRAGEAIECPNEGEFRAYYILHQMDNEGQVESYVTSLSSEVLASAPIQYALEIVASRRVQNFAKFFRLIREGKYLEGCSLLKYVGFMRIQALKVLCRTMRPAKQIAMHPIADLTNLMLFDDDDQTAEFLDYCGLKMDYSILNAEGSSSTDPADEVFCVALDGRNIVDSLPVHEKSGAPLLPDTMPFVRVVESKIAAAKLSRSDVVLGHSSRGARPFLGNAADEQEFYRRQVLLTRSLTGKGAKQRTADAETPAFVSRLATKPASLASTPTVAQSSPVGFKSSPVAQSPVLTPAPLSKVSTPFAKASPVEAGKEKVTPLPFAPPAQSQPASLGSFKPPAAAPVANTGVPKFPEFSSPKGSLSSAPAASTSTPPIDVSKGFTAPSSTASPQTSFLSDSFTTATKPPPSPEVSKKRAPSSTVAPLNLPTAAPEVPIPTAAPPAPPTLATTFTPIDSKAKEDQHPAISAAAAPVPVMPQAPPVTGIAAAADSSRLSIDVSSTWRLSPAAIFDSTSSSFSGTNLSAAATKLSAGTLSTETPAPAIKGTFEEVGGLASSAETAAAIPIKIAEIILPEVVVQFRPRNFGVQSAPKPRPPVSPSSYPPELDDEGQSEGEMVNPMRDHDADMLRIASGAGLSDQQRHRILDAERDVAAMRRLRTQRVIFHNLYRQVFTHIEKYRLKRLTIMFRCWSGVYATRTSRRRQFEAQMRGASIASNPQLAAESDVMMDSFSRLAVRRELSKQSTPAITDGIAPNARRLFELKQEWFQEPFSANHEVADTLRSAHSLSLAETWGSSADGMDECTIAALAASQDVFWKLAVLSPTSVAGIGSRSDKFNCDCVASTAFRALLASESSSDSMLASYDSAGVIGRCGMHIRVVDAPCFVAEAECQLAVAGSTSLLMLVPRRVLADDEQRAKYASSVKKALSVLQCRASVVCIFTDDGEPDSCTFGEVEILNEPNSPAAMFINDISNCTSKVTIEGVFFTAMNASFIGTAGVESVLRSCLSAALGRVAGGAHHYHSRPLQRVDVEREAVRRALAAVILGDANSSRYALRTESASMFLVSLANKCIHHANSKVNAYLQLLEQAMASSGSQGTCLPAIDFATHISGSDEGSAFLIEGVCVVDGTRAVQALGLEPRLDALLSSLAADASMARPAVGKSSSQLIGPSPDDLALAFARLSNDASAHIRSGAQSGRLRVGAAVDESGVTFLSFIEGRYNTYAALHNALSEYILGPIDTEKANGISDCDGMISSVLSPYVDRLQARGWKRARAVLEGPMLTALQRVFSRDANNIPFYEISVLVIQWMFDMFSARLNESRSRDISHVAEREVLLPWRRYEDEEAAVPAALPWYLHRHRASANTTALEYRASGSAIDNGDGAVSRKRPWDFHGHHEEDQYDDEEVAVHARSKETFTPGNASSSSSGRLRMRSASPPLGLVDAVVRFPSFPLSPGSPLPTTTTGTRHAGGSSAAPNMPSIITSNSSSPGVDDFKANVNVLYDSFYN